MPAAQLEARRRSRSTASTEKAPAKHSNECQDSGGRLRHGRKSDRAAAAADRGPEVRGPLPVLVFANRAADGIVRQQSRRAFIFAPNYVITGVDFAIAVVVA